MSIPLLDGWKATRILKSDASTRDIPVIALTAFALPQHREQALAAGCDAYLSKPAEPRRVAEEVARVLRRSAAAAARRATRDADPPARVVAEPPPAGMRPDAVLPGDLAARIDRAFGSSADPIGDVTGRALVHLAGIPWMAWEGDACTFHFTYVSESAELVLGYPRGRWTAEPVFWAETVVNPDDRDEAVAFCAVATGQGKDHAFEYRARHADGRVVWLHDAVRVLKGERGVPVRLRGIMIDITPGRAALVGGAAGAAALPLP